MNIYKLTVNDYQQWFVTARPGSKWQYAEGYLPLLRKGPGSSAADALADHLWNEAGGWPRPKTMNGPYLNMSFRKTQVNIHLVQKRLGYMNYQYFAVKRKPEEIK